MKLKLLFLCLISLTIVTSFQTAFSEPEPILITMSPSMESVIFDGKWTNLSEWKQSSHNRYDFDNGKVTIHLRTAHFGDYIYVFVDSVNDLTLDENMDRATICLDGENNKSQIYDSNDFCFSVLLGNNEGITFQGKSIDEFTTVLQKIPNHIDYVSMSSVSDENDRYSKTLHPSYEFKIPIRLLERSDNYGFYFSVYDASLDKYYSWPKNSVIQNIDDIPFSSEWGDIISPDKSLPEMNFPIFIFSILIFTIIIIQSRTKIGIFRS